MERGGAAKTDVRLWRVQVQTESKCVPPHNRIFPTDLVNLDLQNPEFGKCGTGKLGFRQMATHETGTCNAMIRQNAGKTCFGIQFLYNKPDITTLQNRNTCFSIGMGSLRALPGGQS